jgi:hypothetical protein
VVVFRRRLKPDRIQRVALSHSAHRNRSVENCQLAFLEFDPVVVATEDRFRNWLPFRKERFRALALPECQAANSFARRGISVLSLDVFKGMQSVIYLRQAD